MTKGALSNQRNPFILSIKNKLFGQNYQIFRKEKTSKIGLFNRLCYFHLEKFEKNVNRNENSMAVMCLCHSKTVRDFLIIFIAVSVGYSVAKSLSACRRTTLCGGRIMSNSGEPCEQVNKLFGLECEIQIRAPKSS